MDEGKIYSLIAALYGFAHHSPNCSTTLHPLNTCDCGLDKWRSRAHSEMLAADQRQQEENPRIEIAN